MPAFERAGLRVLCPIALGPRTFALTTARTTTRYPILARLQELGSRSRQLSSWLNSLRQLWLRREGTGDLL
jgi:hypothetical protein